MTPFKKHVACILAFFILFTGITLCQFTLLHPLCYSLKITNYGMREKMIFVYIAALAHQRITYQRR